MTQQDSPVKLTQYARGAGCGCKIVPKALEEISDALKSHH